jgi:yecA family protein
VIWGAEVPDESVFSNLEEASELLQLIMRRWNSIIGELDKTSVYLPLVQEPDERGVSGRAWARGFMRGVRLSGSAGWAELFTAESEGSLLVIPIVAAAAPVHRERRGAAREHGRRIRPRLPALRAVASSSRRCRARASRLSSFRSQGRP